MAQGWKKQPGSSRSNEQTAEPDTGRPKVQRLLLTVKETAYALNISASTIRCGTHRKAKTKFPIKPVRIGTSVRFDLRDVMAYIDQMKKDAE
jgi:predicted DNA-binding transcriptional regulator AlpA